MIACFISSIVIAWIQRLIRRVALVRAIGSRAGREWLLNGEPDGADAAPATTGAAAAALKSRWRLRFRGLVLICGVDVLTFCLALLGTVVMVGQTRAWFDGYIVPPMAGTGITPTLRFREGAFVAGGAVAAFFVAASVTLVSVLSEVRKARAFRAAAGAAGGYAGVSGESDDSDPMQVQA